jgi:hypothetical protein
MHRAGRQALCQASAGSGIRVEGIARLKGVERCVIVQVEWMWLWLLLRRLGVGVRMGVLKSAIVHGRERQR